VAFGNTPFHCLLRPDDLSSLLALGLRKRREQDDPSARGNPIGDPHLATFQMESKPTQLPVQLTGMGLVREKTELAQPVDVEPHPIGCGVAEVENPVPHLWLELNRSPHSVHAIPTLDPQSPWHRGSLRRLPGFRQVIPEGASLVKCSVGPKGRLLASVLRVLTA